MALVSAINDAHCVFCIIIILRLRNRRLQDFSMYFDLWQAWLSGLLAYCLLHTPTTIECWLSKMRVGILASCCHEVGCGVQIYCQAQGTSTGDFEHGG